MVSSKTPLASDTVKLTDYGHAIGKLNHMIDTLFEKLTSANENFDFIPKKDDTEFAILDFEKKTYLY